ncbi:MAG: hypothetical protein HY290_33740, partial [Planctomycetia bacterium]|nr:hypothetical protein [Planctomycetia bacterium]
ASAISFADVLHALQNDFEFRSFFISTLAAAPFEAFRWEMPPITAATADRAFEFVLLDSPELATTPQPDSFASHFDDLAMRQGVVAFPNLGNDAVLVVPSPVGPSSVYGHLASFIRGAPVPQMHALWELVGSTMEHRVGATPVWLSTAGAGVPWLHVRLDNRPKYYGYKPYRNMT